MATIIAGGFDVVTDADAAVDRLKRAGVDMDDMCTFGIMPAGEHHNLPAGGDRAASPGAKGAGKGAGTGAAIGAAAGLAAGAAAIPLLGPAGLAAGAAAGAYAGSLVGALEAHGPRAAARARVGAPRGDADRGECGCGPARTR